MLEVAGKYNKLSDQLRKEIMAAYTAAGKKAIFKFNIAHKNPAYGERGQPEFIWPMLYELSPITFQIIDKISNDVVNIGMVTDTNEKGEPTGFRRLWLKEHMRGVYELELGTAESRDIFAYMYLHPKQDGGKYQDKKEMAKFKLTNKSAEASASYSKREQRADATTLVMSMTPADIKDFASAIGWDENEEIVVLKEQIMEMAEEQTEEFLKLSDGNITYKATIKRALNNQVIDFVPVENKYVWAGNKQTIAALERGDGTMKGSIEQFADWLVTSKNGKEIYDRIVQLLKPVHA